MIRPIRGRLVEVSPTPLAGMRRPLVDGPPSSAAVRTLFNSIIAVACTRASARRRLPGIVIMARAGGHGPESADELIAIHWLQGGAVARRAAGRVAATPFGRPCHLILLATSRQCYAAGGRSPAGRSRPIVALSVRRTGAMRVAPSAGFGLADARLPISTCGRRPGSDALGQLGHPAGRIAPARPSPFRHAANCAGSVVSGRSHTPVVPPGATPRVHGCVVAEGLGVPAHAASRFAVAELVVARRRAWVAAAPAARLRAPEVKADAIAGPAVVESAAVLENVVLRVPRLRHERVLLLLRRPFVANVANRYPDPRRLAGCGGPRVRPRPFAAVRLWAAVAQRRLGATVSPTRARGQPMPADCAEVMGNLGTVPGEVAAVAVLADHRVPPAKHPFHRLRPRRRGGPAPRAEPPGATVPPGPTGGA